MKPADGISLFFVDDQGVLFDEPAQRLYHLNTSTAFIWCLLEDGLGESEIHAELQRRLGLTPPQASAYLDSARGIFLELQVLAESPREFAAPASVPASAPAEDGTRTFVAERRYRLLSSRIAMRFTDESQLRKIAPVLDHLLDEEHGQVTTSVDIIRRDDGRFVLLRNAVPTLGCDHLDQLAPLAKSLVWQTAVNEQDFFLDIHAGVVANTDLAIVLPARPGSGKSTLTSALTHAGFEYFSDEVALLDEAMRVMPVPLALCVKDTGTDVMKRFFPQLPTLDLHRRSDHKRVRYVAPPSERLPAPGTRRKIGAVVFPEYTPDGDTALWRLDRLPALRRFLAECLIVDTRLDVNKVAGLLQWFERVPCYRLSVSDLDQAVGLVKQLADSRKCQKS